MDGQSNMIRDNITHTHTPGDDYCIIQALYIYVERRR